MKKLLLLIFSAPVFVFAQTNIQMTSATADAVLKGNYDPVDYAAAQPLASFDAIICEINKRVSTDSLHSYLKKLDSFHNRNTYADTLSSTTGVGAARRWVYDKFEQFSQAEENRLVTSYMQFDIPSSGTCGAGRFKNILTVLPGADTSAKGIVLIEAHMDSRCEDVCDTTCYAPGMDDNGSGTALVLELARVMSKYTFDHTIVFMATVGEEQGLYGAQAFATYANNNNIPIKAVQNNDIVGGIICGETSSPPGCSPNGDIDSTHVRIYSKGPMFNSPHRAYARFVKLNYNKNVRPFMSVPMEIVIINQEDRTGRGGDHMPFGALGYTALRFTSANEHGHGGPDASYTDRQHTTDDILGVDTDNDGKVDSFFVDFNYLKRNTVINGTSAATAARNIKTPAFDVWNDVDGVKIDLVSDPDFLLNYAVGVRTTTNDFDVVYHFKNQSLYTIPGLMADSTYFISVAGIDESGAFTLFGTEYSVTAQASTAENPEDTLATNTIDCSSVGIETPAVKPGRTMQGLQLLPASPNPFDEVTTFTVVKHEGVSAKEAFIVVTDLTGKEVKKLKVSLDRHINEVNYHHGIDVSGIFHYSLVADGKVIATRKLVFAK